MLCSEFKKPGGGKGRPGRAMRCMSCNVAWGEHGSSAKSAPSIVKKKPRDPNEKIEIEAVEIRPTIPNVIQPEYLSESIGATSIIEEDLAPRVKSINEKDNLLWETAIRILNQP